MTTETLNKLVFENPRINGRTRNVILNTELGYKVLLRYNPNTGVLTTRKGIPGARAHHRTITDLKALTVLSKKLFKQYFPEKALLDKIHTSPEFEEQMCKRLYPKQA